MRPRLDTVVLPKTLPLLKVGLSHLVFSHYHMHASGFQSSHVEPTRIRSICKENVGFHEDIINSSEQAYLGGLLAFILPP